MRTSMRHIDLLYVFDDNYAPYAGVSITSLCQNLSQDCSADIYLGALSVSEENWRLFHETEERVNEARPSDGRIRLIPLDCTEAIRIIQAHKTGEWNGSKATWLKAFLPSFLPESVEWVLYIDSDTLVLGDVAEILDEIEGEAEFDLAAVLESIAYYAGENLGLDSYYNAGVLLMRASIWRTPSFQEAFLDCLDRQGERHIFNEQCLLNDYFGGKIHRLPVKWNLQGFHLLYSVEEYQTSYHPPMYYNAEELTEAREHPQILHFFRILGNYPWEEDNMHPASPLFHEWLAQSAWAGLPDKKKKRKMIFRIERLLYRILPKRSFIRLFKLMTDHR